MGVFDLAFVSHSSQPIATNGPPMKALSPRIKLIPFFVHSATSIAIYLMVSWFFILSHKHQSIAWLVSSTEISLKSSKYFKAKQYFYCWLIDVNFAQYFLYHHMNSVACGCWKVCGHWTVTVAVLHSSEVEPSKNMETEYRFSAVCTECISPLKFLSHAFKMLSRMIIYKMHWRTWTR